MPFIVLTNSGEPIEMVSNPLPPQVKLSMYEKNKHFTAA